MRLRAKRRFCSSVNGLSERGRIHCGVRWKTWTDRAPLASSGTICAALAPVPIDGHPAVRQVVLVLPARRVEAGPGEGRQTLEVGHRRRREGPDGGDEHVGLAGAALGVGEPPAPCAGIPRRRRDARVRPQVGADAEAVGAVLEVAEDLGLVGVRLGPVGLQGEGIGVEVRGHVAGGAGVGVRPPGAADAVGRLEDHEVAPAGLDQLDGQSEAARPRSDDGDLPVRDARPRRHPWSSRRRARRHRRVCTFATGPPGEGIRGPESGTAGRVRSGPERGGRGGT